MTLLAGFSRGEYGEGAYGQLIPVIPTGVAGTSAVGTVIPAAGAGVAPTGVAGTSAVGTVTAVPSVEVAPTGVAGTSAVGAVALTGEAKVAPTGVEATGAIGAVNVWGIIDASQTSSFSGVSTSQTPDWIKIAA